MSRSKVEGTKIAQAAKDLNVTSVTIRRYIQEFNIETATDENGIKVLPKRALDELQEVRRLKEDGLTNPKVMEYLEEMREKGFDEEKTEKKKPAKAKATRKTKVVEQEPEAEEEEAEVQEVVKEEPTRKRAVRVKAAPPKEVEEKVSEEEEEEGDKASAKDSEEEMPAGDGQSKHSLTCQTCGKTFEHMNPRLRDCLDCYRTKRKERRRGGDKHKNVIQNPLAQQVLSKQNRETNGQTPEVRESAKLERPDRADRLDRAERPERLERPDRAERFDRLERPDRPERTERPERSVALAAKSEPSAWAQVQKPVRSYRKAIEETRLITGSLKRRLERPDLPEGERRWLEQIYAYQLILHQGWRHLSEYKSGSPIQAKQQED